jgi:hypothetical protein
MFLVLGRLGQENFKFEASQVRQHGIGTKTDRKTNGSE